MADVDVDVDVDVDGDGDAVRVAVAPHRPEWAIAAVRAGGGTVVGLGDDPEALVWVAPSGGSELGDAVTGAPSLRWVQLPWAGIDAYADHLQAGRGVTWTSAKGAYAAPVAEHALALSLAVFRSFPQRARARSWGRPAGRSLFDTSVVVLGGGGIAAELITLLAPFRCEVTVVRRTATPMPGAARTVTTDRLHEVLPAADLLVLALALTPATVGIIGTDELRLMATKTACLVNVARGRHVDTGALLAALDQGWIGGAGLDVTDPEPLPEGHPLWDQPNVLVTPHTADTPDMVAELLAHRITDNVTRYRHRQPLVGLVDPHAGY